MMKRIQNHERREIIPRRKEPRYVGTASFGSSRNMPAMAPNSAAHRIFLLNNMWYYEGSIITEYTLKYQRGVAFDPIGRWTRPKGGGTSISLPEET